MVAAGSGTVEAAEEVTEGAHVTEAADVAEGDAAAVAMKSSIEVALMPEAERKQLLERYNANPACLLYLRQSSMYIGDPAATRASVHSGDALSWPSSPDSTGRG